MFYCSSDIIELLGCIDILDFQESDFESVMLDLFLNKIISTREFEMALLDEKLRIDYEEKKIYNN